MATEIHVHLTEQKTLSANPGTDVLLLQELGPLMTASEVEGSGTGDMELDLECTDDGNYVIPETEESRLLQCTSIVGQNIQFQITFSDASQEERLVEKEKFSYECCKCNQQFTMERKYVRHMAAKHGIKSPFRCPLCHYGACSKKLILRHAKRKHNDSSECTNVSDLCMKGTAEETVNVQNDFTCKECSITYKQKRSYEQHMMRHRKEFNYKCTECNKSFVSKLALKRHLLCHSFDRKFVCDEADCGKSFKHQGALTDHRKYVHSMCRGTSSHPVNEDAKTHSNVDTSQTDFTSTEAVVISKGRNNSKYVCPWESCEKKFRDKYNLRQHCATHTGQRDKRCPHCEFSCIQKASLDFHIKKHHS